MQVFIGVTIWVAAGLALARGATGAETITFGTDWKAEAEHGGYYQAIATGIYRRHGLDVTLRQGGPQVNHAQLLAGARLHFILAPNSFIPLNFVGENIPMVAVAAIIGMFSPTKLSGIKEFGARMKWSRAPASSCA